MASVLNRNTMQYLRSVNAPEYPAEDWIINPDLSAVAGVDRKYWKISGDAVSEMSQAEQDAVDAAEVAAETQRIKDLFDDVTDERWLIVKFALIRIVSKIPGYTAGNLRDDVFSDIENR